MNICPVMAGPQSTTTVSHCLIILSMCADEMQGAMTCCFQVVPRQLNMILKVKLGSQLEQNRSMQSCQEICCYMKQTA